MQKIAFSHFYFVFSFTSFEVEMQIESEKIHSSVAIGRNALDGNMIGALKNMCSFVIKSSSNANEGI
jgi:uncharacterized membrane protein YoaK (UPF0700 family)